MVQINYARREVSCKVVYYGPGLSGKTTNIEIIHEKDPNKEKGNLTSIATEGDRTLYFDYKPLDLGQISGMTTKFQLYTVPGQLYYNSTRKLVLTGADGVVFVADSQKTKMNDNLASLNNLEENLKEHDMELSKIAFILQYNKRDLPDIFSVEEMNNALNKYNSPYFEAVAFKGTGVFETLKAIASVVLKKISADSDLVKERGSRIAPKRPQAQAVNTGQNYEDPDMTGAYSTTAPYPTPYPTPTPSPSPIAYTQGQYPPQGAPLGYNSYNAPQANSYATQNSNYSQQPSNYTPPGGMGYRPPYSAPPQGGNYPPPQGGNYPPPQGGNYPPPQGGNYPPPQGGNYPPPQGGNYPPPQGNYGMGNPPRPATPYPSPNAGGNYNPSQPPMYPSQQPPLYRPGVPNPYANSSPPPANYPKPPMGGVVGNYPSPNPSGTYSQPPQGYRPGTPPGSYPPPQSPAGYPKPPGHPQQQPYPPPPPGYNPSIQSGLYTRPASFPQPPKKPGMPPGGGNPEKK